MNALFIKANILKKLEMIHRCALNIGDWHAAARVAKLQGKIVDLFEKQPLAKKVRLADMRQGQLAVFIGDLGKRNPMVKGQEGEAISDRLPP